MLPTLPVSDAAAGPWCACWCCAARMARGRRGVTCPPRSSPLPEPSSQPNPMEPDAERPAADRPEAVAAATCDEPRGLGEVRGLREPKRPGWELAPVPVPGGEAACTTPTSEDPPSSHPPDAPPPAPRCSAPGAPECTAGGVPPCNASGACVVLPLRTNPLYCLACTPPAAACCTSTAPRPSRNAFASMDGTRTAPAPAVAGAVAAAGAEAVAPCSPGSDPALLLPPTPPPPASSSAARAAVLGEGLRARPGCDAWRLMSADCWEDEWPAVWEDERAACCDDEWDVCWEARGCCCCCCWDEVGAGRTGCWEADVGGEGMLAPLALRLAARLCASAASSWVQSSGAAPGWKPGGSGRPTAPLTLPPNSCAMEAVREEGAVGGVPPASMLASDACGCRPAVDPPHPCSPVPPVVPLSPCTLPAALWPEGTTAACPARPCRLPALDSMARSSIVACALLSCCAAGGLTRPLPEDKAGCSSA